MVLYKWDTVEMTFHFISEVEYIRTRYFHSSDKLCAVYLIHPYNVAKKSFFFMCITIHKLPSHFHALPHLTLVSDFMEAVMYRLSVLSTAFMYAHQYICVCVCLDMAGFKDDAVPL